jgi:hypothetical protein
MKRIAIRAGLAAFFVQAFFDDYSNANAESGENQE